MADYKNEEVIIFDKDLKFVRTFGRDSGDGKLHSPKGVAVNLNVVAVSDQKDHVVKFSLLGHYLTKFGSHGGGDGQFNELLGLCFNSKGLLYVVDSLNQRVQVFKKNLFQKNVFLFKFDFKFCGPEYIAVDSNDRLYVTDDDGLQGFEIKVFSENGCFIKSMDSLGSCAICIAPDDHIITSASKSFTMSMRLFPMNLVQ